MTAYYRTMQGASKTAVKMAENAKGATVDIDKLNTSSKAAALGMKALSIAGNMLLMYAITKAISLVINAIDDYIHRLDNAREKLEETRSELETVNSELEETQKQIDALNAKGNLSITEKDDLAELRAQNKELQIRAKYLKMQEERDAKETAKLAKEEYSSKYGSATTQDDVDSYGETINPTQTPGKETVAPHAVQGSPTQSQYYTNTTNYNSLAGQIALYQKYDKAKSDILKKDPDVITEKDNKNLKKYNQKIEDIEKELSDKRTELQGYYDDFVSAGDHNSNAYKNVVSDLALIDKTLFSKSDNLVNFLNSEQISSSTEKLKSLAESGKLTEQALKDKFAEVYQYLFNNSLSVDDLISVLVTRSDEISSPDADIPKNFKDAWKQFSTDESTKESAEKLKELAESGSLTVKAFEGIGGAEEYFEKIGLSAEEATKKINGLVDETKPLSTLKSSIGSLQTAYAEKKDDGVVGADTFSGMEETFGKLDYWDKYKQILGSSTSSLKQCRDAQNKLATQYVRSKNFLSGLVDETGKCTKANRQYYIEQLKELGIKNATEVVDQSIAKEQDKLTAQKILETKTSEELTKMTSKEIEGLLKENNATQSVKNEFLSLIATETIFNNTSLSVSDKIKSLMEVAKAAGVATAEYTVLEQAMNKSGSLSNKDEGNQKESFAKQNGIKVVKNTGRDKVKDANGNFVEDWDYVYNGKTYTNLDEAYQDKLYNDVDTRLKNASEVSIDVVPTSPTKDKSSSSSSSKQTFDWIERRIQKFQTKFDRWKKQAESSSLSFIDKYYKKSITNAKKLLNTESSAYSKYMSKANNVKLSSKYKKKVRNGTIDIQTIKNEKTVDKIQKYQDYYDKAISSLDSFIEKADELYNLPLDKATTKIEKFSDSIELLDLKLDNAIGSSAKNALINQKTSEKKSTLNANKTAQKETSNNVKSAGKTLISSKSLKNSGVTKKEKAAIKKAVANGQEVDLSFFKEGSKGYKAAVKYNAAIRANSTATLEAAKSQEEYNSWLVEAAKLQFDNIAQDYERKVQINNYGISGLDNQIAEIEASGRTVGSAFYNSKKNLNEQNKQYYQNELKALNTKLADGSIKKGTDAWYEALDAIQECEDNISKCVQTTYDLNKAITELHFETFNDIAEGINRIINEQEFLQGLFDHEKVVDEETGSFTEAGLAKVTSTTANYYASKEKTANDKAEIEELDRMLKSGSLSSKTLGITFNSIDELKKKRNEMYQTWQDDIKETYKLETELADMMKEQYQAQLDLLKELIDKRIESLNIEKDLHDYHNSIRESTSNISLLQKQLASYSGDSSQEGMARVQQLQKELKDAQDNLKEQEYERYIQDQEDMLNKLFEEAEELTTKKLDEFKELVDKALDIGNNNTAIANAYLAAIAKQSGYNIQYDGLFKDGNVQENVANEVRSIENNEKTKNVNTSSPNNGSGAYKTGTNNTPAPTNNTPPAATPKKTTYTEAQKKSVEAVFAKSKYYAKGKKKKASDYETTINQYLFKNNKKVLSSDGLKEIRKILGVNNSGIKSALTTMHNEMGNIKNVGGFKTGGIAKLVKSRGEDGLAMVRNGEGFIAPEHVPAIEKLIDTVPQINDILQPLVELPKVPDFKQNHIASIGDVSLNLELPNVKNGNDFVRELQTNPKLQKAIRSVSTDMLNGGGRLSVKNIK